MQTGNRAAQFPAMLSTLPDGNAVVFVQGGEKIAGLQTTAGPSVSIITHPTNPQAKLLVLTGNSDAEMLRVASAIALVSSTLVGQTVMVTKDTPVAARKPYDAPAWVPLDRPVKFGELAKPEELRVQGWYPEVIRLNYRIAPDVFTWRSQGAPMQLKYRFTRLPEHKSSSLNINLNNNFVHALPLNQPYKTPEDVNRLNLTGSDNVSKKSDLLFIPPYAVGGRDQLQLGYYFDILKHGECQNMPPENLQASIDAESTLDFSSFPHYAALPNLAYFAGLGFPFTRMADLSETAVIMPDRPNASEIGTYLTVMGRLGEATGYPVLRHTNFIAADVDKAADMDMIVIGSANSQALLTKWADRLPVVQINGERRVREPDPTWMPTYRWEEKDVQYASLTKGDLNLTGGGELTTLMAFESPLKASRSVVVIHADKALDLQKVTDVLTDPERVGLVKGDLVVVDDKNVLSTKVSATYYLGSLPLMNRLEWFFTDRPLWVGSILLVLCLLTAFAAYRPLKNLFAKLALRAKPKLEPVNLTEK
jgi:hypothetical protein